MVSLNGLELYIELLKVFHLLLGIEEREYLALPSSLPTSYDKDQTHINKIYEYVFKKYYVWNKTQRGSCAGLYGAGFLLQVFQKEN